LVVLGSGGLLNNVNNDAFDDDDDGDDDDDDDGNNDEVGMDNTVVGDNRESTVETFELVNI
jgi:hypothetical protein